jgi:hypothetical protein
VIAKKCVLRKIRYILSIEMSTRQKKIKRFFCQRCHHGFTRKDSLNRHQNDFCKIMKLETPIIHQELTHQELAEVVHNLREAVELVHNLREEVAEMRNQPTNIHIHNQVLQVIRMGQNDSYLDMST